MNKKIVLKKGDGRKEPFVTPYGKHKDCTAFRALDLSRY